MLPVFRAPVPRVRAAATGAALCLSGAATDLRAEPASLQGHATGAVAQISENPELGFRRGSLVVAPIPFSNPLIGSGLALGAGYLFTTDESSDSSYFGLGGLRSDNGSIGYGLGANVSFVQNRWKIGGILVKADVNYDIYLHVGGATRTIPINQTGKLGSFTLGYGVSENLHLGVDLKYLESTVSAVSGILPAQIAPDARLELFNAGLTLDWDRRDDTLYPTRGTRLFVASSHGMSLRRLKRDYNRSYANFDALMQVGERGVLAARISGCSATDDSPFFYKCSLGMTDAFRGFSATRYLGERSLSAQVEFRQRLGKRLGVVAFAGAGRVKAQAAPQFDGKTHWAGGVGARYRLSRKFPLDFSVDGSRNSDGDNLLYVYVGQRF